VCEFLAGKFRLSNQHLEQAIALYDPAQHRHHAFVQGTDPAVIAYSINAWALWFAGRLDEAARNSAQAIEAAGRAEHPFSMAYALCLAASLAQCRGRSTEAVARCDAAARLSLDHAFPYWRAWASMVKGAALVELGDRDTGFEMLKDGLDRYAATGAAQMRSYGLCLLAEAYQRSALWTESAEAARAAIAEAARTGVAFFLPEAHRLAGEALCQLGPGKAAGPLMLLRAARVAEGQDACSPLLRACLSLLERNGRPRLRTIIVAKAAATHERMQQGGSAAELAPLRERLDRAVADRRPIRGPRLPGEARN
jgi:tetratricopeptide (TPR) repeat protein